MPLLPAFRRAARLLALAAAPALCFAVDTHVWEQSDQADFTRGTIKNLSIRSDGRLTIAPEFKELDSTTVPYLWALARDSKGTVYYAGGAPTGASTKIFALTPGSKSRTFAECPGLEIHALALDSKDRLYAAVLPDAKVYRFDKTGKSELFFDPHEKYIWAMAFDKSGNLFVATGDSGLVYKVSQDGKGAQFADTKESHARSMVIDSAGNLIIGTEPGGLVMRISPQGESFVLFQTRKREVTSVAIHDGIIYAVATGTKPAVVSGPPPVLPSTPPPATPAGAQHIATTPPSPAPSIGSLSASTSGGSDLDRIQPDGSAERLWESATDIAYDVAFDAAGRPLVATGNKGVIYRIDSDHRSTVLLNAPPTQVTAFLQGANGTVYAATGNVGNLYSIGPGSESAGTFESEVLDAGEFSYWGKIHISANSNHGAIVVEARSGNLNNPQHDWSPWTRVPVDVLGGKVSAPPARFLQYRLKLTNSPEGQSPELGLIDIPYLPKNLAPRVEQLEIAPVNYRQAPSTSLLDRTVVASGSAASITLPAVGQRRTASTSNPEMALGATLQYSKGAITLRWSASDPNHDAMLYKVEIRGRKETQWRVLKNEVQDSHWAFDSADFADGEYIARITATDAPGNAPGEALTGSLDSDPFTIDNTPPEITDVKTESGQISFTAKDALSWIDKAEYSINGGEWQVLQPLGRVTDSQVLPYELKAAPGQLIAIRVFDENDNAAVRTVAVP